MAQEMLEKNGFVGSGIICLNAQILSKSSSIRFEKRTLGGTKKASETAGFFCTQLNPHPGGLSVFLPSVSRTGIRVGGVSKPGSRA